MRDTVVVIQAASSIEWWRLLILFGLPVVMLLVAWAILIWKPKWVGL